MKKKLNSKKGFTLVEIIVVLVILAIMAGFAIPAYNGYIDKAKQSEILAEGRALLVAAQTIGQEQYGKTGELGNSADGVLELAMYNSIEALSGAKGAFIVSMTKEGTITSLEYENLNDTYKATYTSGSWTTVKLTAGTISKPADGTAALVSVVLP